MGLLAGCTICGQPRGSHTIAGDCALGTGHWTPVDELEMEADSLRQRFEGVKGAFRLLYREHFGTWPTNAQLEHWMEEGRRWNRS